MKELELETLTAEFNARASWLFALDSTLRTLNEQISQEPPTYLVEANAEPREENIETRSVVLAAIRKVCNDPR